MISTRGLGNGVNQVFQKYNSVKKEREKELGDYDGSVGRAGYILLDASDEFFSHERLLEIKFKPRKVACKEPVNRKESLSLFFDL